jgi:hypothetical protein
MPAGSDEAGMGDGQRDDVETVQQALQRLVRSRIARKSGGHLLDLSSRPLDLPLRLRLDPPLDGSAFSGQLLESIDGWIDDAISRAAAFRPGHAWCHRCASVACEHSRPATSRLVFAGYTATGLPCWEDFAQFCLDRKHPEVDRLYRDPPAFLTVVQGRDEISGRMLEAFEDGSYELLGQLLAGFFYVHARSDAGRGVLALTIQVAASRGRSGDRRLGLNLLGCAPSGAELESLWDGRNDLPWRKGIRWAQAALLTLAPQNGRRPSALRRAELEHRVHGILQGLARRLEQHRRATGRRTRHAEERHDSGQRPTRKAIDDARRLAVDSLFVDERAGTLVVLGERGRTHFFTADGRLVSSVRYTREAIERKLRTRLWRPASDALRLQFRSQLPD